MAELRLRSIAFSVAALVLPLCAQTNVAVIPLDAKGVSEIEASVLTERLALELFRTGRFTVLERGKMEEILIEQDFQLTGCVSEECLVEVGQLLGVEQMMAGSVSRIGETYSVILRLISAETGAIVQVASYDHRGAIDELLSEGMRLVALSMAGETVEHAKPSIPVPAVDQKVASAARQGHLYVFPRLGWGFSSVGPSLSFGGQVGYGNESWGKVFIDFMEIEKGGQFKKRGLNVLALYEPGFRPMYWQVGLGLVSDAYYEEWENAPYVWVAGLGFRVGLGYNYALGKYIMIRPALELNLGFNEYQSNYSINLNFGFKTPNLR